MDNKILEILLEMQSDIKNIKDDVKNVKDDVKNVNKKLDILEFKMNDGFETLELLSENNANDLNRIKIKVSKLEKRITEMNTVN